jgi:aspartate aminotransferase
MIMQDIKELNSPSVFIGKQGKGIISFGSGQPDLPPPKEAVENINIRCDLRYGLIQGEPKLRQALSKEYPKSTADNFIITNGASEALDLIFRAMDSGKVLIPKPYYYSYPHILKHANMTPAYTKLDKGRILLDDFEKKVHECQAVLINSPSNPTGRIESIKTLKEIEKITKDLHIPIVSDEVYKDLMYERDNYMVQGDHVVTINSFSKTYAMCGVRVGYLWSNDMSLVKKAIEIKTHTSMNTNLIGQDMALNAMKAPKSYQEDQLKIWKQRRDIIYEGLQDLGLDLWKPEGAFYVLPKVKDPKHMVWNLYKRYNIITYLGEWFGADDRIRLSYALDKEQIEEGLKRIEKWMEED